MTTSGTTALTMTARDFVTRAMQEAQILPLGVAPTDAELTYGLTTLNGMLKSLQTRGVVWGMGEGTVTLGAGQASGTLPADVRNVTNARVVGANGYHRELGPWTRADYQQLPNRTQSGTPSVFYVDRQRGGAAFYVWPVPTVETEIVVDYVRSLEVATDGTQTLDVPEEWAEAIWTNLAVRLADTYGAPISPSLEGRAATLLAMLLDDSRPDSYFMGAACG